MKVVEQEFYLQNTVDVAQKLLGCILCRKINNVIYRAKIVETEAYTQDDPACHAYRGKTPRSEVMFKEGGIAYVYFIYGMYYCLNVVTEQEGRGCAVLIRAVEPLGDFDNTNGPAKLCKALDITKELNGINLTCKNSCMWIEYGQLPQKIVTTTRIGIKSGMDYPWRFYIQDNKWVSKKASN